MFWAGEKILEYFEKEQVVAPYNKEFIDNNAYRLTIGSECFVTSDHKVAWPQTGIQYFDDRWFKLAKASCVIPTGQFAFLITAETIKMPQNAMGFISLRTKKAKFKGLVNISGFHVDPGYHGKLIFAVFNAGPSPIHIRKGDQLFQLWVADIDTSNVRQPLSTYVRNGDLEVSQLSSEIVSDVSDRLVSLQDISKKLEELDIRIFRIYAVGFAFATVITIANIVVLFWSRLKDIFPH